jgi:V-type H+-transporting ATPase subunit a
MIKKKILIPNEIVQDVMNELGSIEESIEFIDLNKDVIESKKNFSKMISRCDEMEKIFIRFEKICQDHNLEIYKYQNFDRFKKDLNRDIDIRQRKYRTSYFDLLENEINEDNKKFQDLIDSFEKIKETLEYLYEKRSVYDKTSQLFLTTGLYRSINREEGMRRFEEGDISDLNYIAGVAKAEDEMRMKRIIFRVSRGRAIPTFFEMPQVTGKEKSVIYCFL